MRVLATLFIGGASAYPSFQLQAQQRVWRLLVMVVVPAAASELPAGAFGDRSGLRAAVSAWVADAGSAEATHGSIAGWDTSRVDDMSYLFVDESTFNAAIGGWDTSQVTSMQSTFSGAKAFNSELAWDTSSVTTMANTFRGADAFNS